LEAADGDSEIYPRPTVTEAVRDPRCVGGCPVGEKSRRLFWFCWYQAKQFFWMELDKRLWLDLQLW
jgi:hypothetical protein